MPRRGPRERCPRTGKAKFTSWDTAAGRAHKLDGDDAHAYYCAWCGGYHVTGNEKRKQGN